MGDNPRNLIEQLMSDQETVELETPSEPVLETVETPPADASEPEAPEVDVEKLQATNKKLFERAKTAEAKLKALSPKSSEATAASPQPTNVEEAVLLAQGMSEELVASLKKVAKVEGISSLIKAQTNPIFVAVKEKFEKEQKQKNAGLGASRGATSVKVEKSTLTPGLTREEHRKMVLGN